MNGGGSSDGSSSGGGGRVRTSRWLLRLLRLFRLLRLPFVIKVQCCLSID